MRATGKVILLRLLFFLACISLLPIQAPAADKLEKGQNLTDADGDTLVSAGGSGGGTFTLGFFSPGASTKRYLGIWFSVSNHTVYWVANRDQPLPDRSGMLLFNDAATLVLLDGSRRTVWSSYFSGGPSAAAAQLLESELQLTSWRSADDPSPGDYRRTLETKGLPELVLWYRDVKAYRTGPWNGLIFNGVEEASTYADLYPLHVSGLTDRSTEITYGYTAVPGAPLTRVVVNYTGVAERLVWKADTGEWIPYFTRAARDNTCEAQGRSWSKCYPMHHFNKV